MAKLHLANILDEFRQNPKSFMRHYKIIIFGGIENCASGVALFSFEDREETVKGKTTGLSGLRGIEKDRRVLRFHYKGASTSNKVSDTTFNAFYIAMHDDVNEFTRFSSFYTLPCQGPTTPSNPDIVLTSQLSGCTFSIGRPSNTSQYVSHIRPRQKKDDNGENIPGVYDRDHLHQTAVHSIPSRIGAIYERENQNETMGYGNDDNVAAVMGLRRNGRWEFYNQTSKELILGTKGNVLQAKRLY